MELTIEKFKAAADANPPTDKQRYAKAYCELLPRLGTPLKMLELGLGVNCASARMWRQLLGDQVVIYGAEINAEFIKSGHGICDHLFLGDLGDPQHRKDIFAKVQKELGQLDLIIDDASHFAEHIHVCFSELSPLLRSGGMYVIEDLETNDRPRYHRQYHPRPVEWLSQIMKNICTGRVGSPSHQLHFYRNLAAMVKQ
jgi:hypothetical protein